MPCFSSREWLAHHPPYCVCKPQASGSIVRGLETTCARLQDSSFKKQAALPASCMGHRRLQRSRRAQCAWLCDSRHGSVKSTSQARPVSVAAHLHRVQPRYGRGHTERSVPGYVMEGRERRAFDGCLRPNLNILSSLRLHTSTHEICGGRDHHLRHDRRQPWPDICSEGRNTHST